MRDIKFRAWDIKQKTMIDPFYLVDDIFTAKKHLFFPSTSGGIDFMQYTGLKDKNGVEIYEGDIVRNSFDDENYEVIFKNGSFVLTSTTQFIYPNSLYYHVKENDIEVIGNIYENPELLEK